MLPVFQEFEKWCALVFTYSSFIFLFLFSWHRLLHFFSLFFHYIDSFALSLFWFKIYVCLCSRASFKFFETCGEIFPGLYYQAWANKFGVQNQSACLTEKELETLLFVFSHWIGLLAFTFNMFPSNATCNETFVVSSICLNVDWMFKIRCLPMNNFHTSDTSVWRCFKKNAKVSTELHKTKSVTDNLIMICRNISWQIILREPSNK